MTARKIVQVGSIVVREDAEDDFFIEMVHTPSNRIRINHGDLNDCRAALARFANLDNPPPKQAVRDRNSLPGTVAIGAMVVGYIGYVHAKRRVQRTIRNFKEIFKP